MERYRHALYRYSTGQGFNVNVTPPRKIDDVNSYKMEPLEERLIKPEFQVDLLREADRVSMQVEAAKQQLKVLGYDQDAGNRYRALKTRLDVIQHLMTNYPIRYIVKKDLERIYDMYKANSPEVNKFIHKVIEQTKGVKEVDKYVDTATKLRKGYPIYDQFGRKLTGDDKQAFVESLKKHKGLSGFGEGNKSIPLLLVAAIVVAIWFKTRPKTEQ